MKRQKEKENVWVNLAIALVLVVALWAGINMMAGAADVENKIATHQRMDLLNDTPIK